MTLYCYASPLMRRKAYQVTNQKFYLGNQQFLLLYWVKYRGFICKKKLWWIPKYLKPLFLMFKLTWVDFPGLFSIRLTQRTLSGLESLFEQILLEIGDNCVSWNLGFERDLNGNLTWSCLFHRGRNGVLEWLPDWPKVVLFS